MSTPSIFGRIVTGADVEEAAMHTLKLWSSTYLAELERQHGLTAGDLPRVRSWTTAPSFDKWPEDQLPAMVLVSIGLGGPPEKRRSSVYTARWLLSIAAVVSASTQQQSHRLAELYVAAHRALLLNRQSLDGFGADGTDWLEESYDDMPYDDARSLGWGIAHFTVQVDDVQTVHAGPTTPDVPLVPDTDPWPDDPVAELVDSELVKLAADGG